MKLAAHVTAAVVAAFLTGLAAAVAVAGKPGVGDAPAVNGTPAMASGTVSLVSQHRGEEIAPQRPVHASITSGPVRAGQGGSGYPAATIGAGLTPLTPKKPWEAASAPLPARARPGSGLSGVACPSATVCVAAGGYAESSGESQGLLLTLHGSSWIPARAPVPAGASANPGADMSGLMACPSVTTCVAAGDYTDSSGNSQVMLLTGHGSSWTAVKAPLPAGAPSNPEASLSGIACPSAVMCVAVGDYTGSSGETRGLLLTGHGSSWTVAQMPLPAGARPGAGLSGVACPSAIVCVAVGYYTGSSGKPQGLLLTRRGSSWTVAQMPLPAGARPGAGLSGVACPSAIVCVAVGYYTGSSGKPQGLLLTRRGSSWTAIRAPLPVGAGAEPSLWGVACPSATACVVAGSTADSSSSPHSPSQGLLLTGHGSSWTAVTAPTPAGASAAAGDSVSLDATACPSASACVVTGHYLDSSGHPEAMLLTGHGSSWTAAKAPLPADAARRPPGPLPPGPALNNVACRSVTVCAAVGDYRDSAGNVQGMLLTGPP